MILETPKRTAPNGFAAEEIVSVAEFSRAFLCYVSGRADVDVSEIVIVNARDDNMEPTVSRDGFCLADTRRKDFSEGGLFVVRSGRGLEIRRVRAEADGSAAVL